MNNSPLLTAHLQHIKAQLETMNKLVLLCETDINSLSVEWLSEDSERLLMRVSEFGCIVKHEEEQQNKEGNNV